MGADWECFRFYLADKSGLSEKLFLLSPFLFSSENASVFRRSMRFSKKLILIL